MTAYQPILEQFMVRRYRQIFNIVSHREMFLFFILSTVIVKPIFHWKLALCWVPNANEINTKSMKCTWATQDFCVGDPTQPIFHCLPLGFGLGPTQILSFASGEKGLRWLQDTNMLVSPTQNSGVRGIAQRQPPTPGILCRSGI